MIVASDGENEVKSEMNEFVFEGIPDVLENIICYIYSLLYVYNIIIIYA